MERKGQYCNMSVWQIDNMMDKRNQRNSPYHETPSARVEVCLCQQKGQRFTLDQEETLITQVQFGLKDSNQQEKKPKFTRQLFNQDSLGGGKLTSQQANFVTLLSALSQNTLIRRVTTTTIPNPVARFNSSSRWDLVSCGKCARAMLAISLFHFTWLGGHGHLGKAKCRMI